jgi:hypothetical protein
MSVLNFNKNINQKQLLCKKMNVNCDIDNCPRSHSINELVLENCYYNENCKKQNCPYIHPYDSPITKVQYFDRMYKYINPYQSFKSSICRYYDIGCKIENCRKAHSIDELQITECDCYKIDCYFYHKNRDENISKKDYFNRMKVFIKTIEKEDNKLLCRYINIGCQREDCPYAHNINELKVHNCIFNNCKNFKQNKCVFLHKNETIDKIEYFERMLKHIQPFEKNNILCNKINCKNINCKYSHSYSDLIIPNCIRESNCKKHCCPFIHPHENLTKKVYYNRMLTSKFPN